MKRIGLMHITHINYRMLKSDYTFNIYWQKYDYDYSNSQTNLKSIRR